MNSTDRVLAVCLAVITLFFLVRISYADNCNLCGSECVSACGTKMFRVCCFNFNRKRSDIPPLWLQTKSRTWEDEEDPEVFLQQLSSGRSSSTRRDKREINKSEDKVLQFLWRNSD